MCCVVYVAQIEKIFGHDQHQSRKHISTIIVCTKGHLISEQICEDLDFPKLQRKYCYFGKSMSSQIFSEIK